jgi:hypothetical protein
MLQIKWQHRYVSMSLFLAANNHFTNWRVNCLLELKFEVVIINYCFSLLSLFRKNKSRLMRSPCCLVCLCLHIPPLPTFKWLKQIFMKLRMSTMAPQLISTACICIPLSLLRNGWVKEVTAATNTHLTIKELLEASFSMSSVSHQRKGDKFFPELLVKILILDQESPK